MYVSMPLFLFGLKTAFIMEKKVVVKIIYNQNGLFCKQ